MGERRGHGGRLNVSIATILDVSDFSKHLRRLAVGIVQTCFGHCLKVRAYPLRQCVTMGEYIDSTYLPTPSLYHVAAPGHGHYYSTKGVLASPWFDALHGVEIRGARVDRSLIHDASSHN
jgi:hypothetical protein